MPIENALQLLEARRSVPSRQLGEPGPDQATLLRMLQTAVRVPDHGRKVPFRFLRITGDARVTLGGFLAERAKQLSPDIAEPALELEHKRFNHAPLVIAVIARPTPHPKVPEIEQLLTSGCVCFALLQAAQAFGFGAQWLTGWAAYDPVIQSRLGLAPGESISGFIHIGTPLAEPPARERPDAAALLHEWTA